VKNVVAIGNASGFVEPLEATALGAIGQQSRTLADLLIDGDRVVTDAARRHYNLYHGRYWDSIRNFLAVHYRFNARVQTPFWIECQEKTDLAGAEEIVAVYRENGPTFLFGATLFTPADQFGPAGYVAMLLGQKVAHQAVHQADAPERRAWESFRELQKQFALGAMTVPETLAAIRSPNWSWERR
jgi:tryptophan halogenase